MEPEKLLLFIGLPILSILVIILLIRIRSLREKSENNQHNSVEENGNEKKYKDLLEACIDGIMTADHNGIILDLNRAAFEMLGYTALEMNNMSLANLLASKEDFLTIINTIKEDGEYRGTVEYKNKEGEIINAQISVSKTKYSNGESSGYFVISKNITEDVERHAENEQLINTVNDMIYSADVQGNFTYTNDTVTSLIGYEKDEIIGHQFHEIIHESHKERIQNDYRAQFKKKIKRSYHEFVINRKDGSTMWVGQEVTTKFNKKDPTIIDGYYGIVRNIDDRKTAAALLQESETRYRELFDNSSELIHSIDTKGNILYANKAWLQSMGYTEEELKNLNYFSVIHPESEERYAKFLKEVIDQLNSKNVLIYKLLTKDGKKIIVEGSFNVNYEDKEVASIQLFVRDITIQKEAEAKLTKQEKTLRQITETLNDVFYLYNVKEKKYEYISPNCENILGVGSEFFHGENNHTETFVNEDFREAMYQAQKNIHLGKSYDIDYQIIVDGKTRWVNEKSFPVLNKQREVVANTGICRDISDLKLAEEIIFSQNQEIGSSIQYAQGIQEAVLPTRQHVESIFEDSFIFFRPKDTVSGDFYIVDHITTNEQSEFPTFIVGDCTGHGVPGAVLSLMCNVLIRESFTRYDVNTPADALDFVRERLISFFGAQDERSIRDGMDIGFCVINDKKDQLYFAGAYISCILIRGKELIEYKGDKQHVGYSDNPIPFTHTVIDLQKDDRIFLYTDGYVDQFGGDRNKKFTRRRLHELLLEICHLSMREIEEHLENELENWQRDFDQIDDITMMGIRYK